MAKFDETVQGVMDMFGMTYQEAVEAVRKTGLDKVDNEIKSSGQDGHVHDVHQDDTPVDHTNWGKSKVRDNHTIIDPMLIKMKQTVWDQQKKVLASGKYPHPIHKDNHSAREWIGHQMQEFADAMVYQECMGQTIEDVIDQLHKIKESDDIYDAHRYAINALARLE